MLVGDMEAPGLELVIGLPLQQLAGGDQLGKGIGVWAAQSKAETKG